MTAIETGIQDVQEDDGQERLKIIGYSDAGIITVITDDSFTRIIIAWHASATEVKEWLKEQK